MRSRKDLTDFFALAVVADSAGYFTGTNARPQWTRRLVGLLCSCIQDSVYPSSLSSVEELASTGYSC